MLSRRAPYSLVSLFVLVAGSMLAVAQMGPDDDRLLPYQGYLELNGAPADTADYTMRFAVFATADADASCLLSDPAGCPLWGEEQQVHVDAGAFSVVLGNASALSDAVLAQDRLFLAIAVSGPADGGAFSALDGKSEIFPVPFAARAAAARDYKVTGSLVVDGNADVGSLDVDSDATANRLHLRVDSDVNTTGTTGTLILGNQSGINMGIDGNEIMARDGDGTSRLHLNLAGGDVAIGNNTSTIEVDGTLDVNAIDANSVVTDNLAFGCGTGWSRVGMWCIENNLRGASGTNYHSAIGVCHDQGASVCSISALMACDTAEPAGATCAATTDTNTWLWTSNAIANDANAYSNVRVYSGVGNDTSNEIDIADGDNTTFAGSTVRFFCCRIGAAH